MEDSTSDERASMVEHLRGSMSEFFDTPFSPVFPASIQQALFQQLHQTVASTPANMEPPGESMMSSEETGGVTETPPLNLSTSSRSE